MSHSTVTAQLTHVNILYVDKINYLNNTVTALIGLQNSEAHTHSLGIVQLLLQGVDGCAMFDSHL